ncbi:unnamed protein product [Dovyalis caffra]|uniref:Uncharacterized protein n=1 Tax=Dovyalis caffra TaxID=77055 RepID=A0AAV1R4Z9_9ROSI|nr:unnamed protein product [Dovyalis caffra]
MTLKGRVIRFLRPCRGGVRFETGQTQAAPTRVAESTDGKTANIIAGNRSAKSGASVIVHVRFILSPVFLLTRVKRVRAKINQWVYKGMEVSDVSLCK